MIIVQSRQAAMGEMISMIAHQWRQPLSIIVMEVNKISLSMLLKEKISDEKLTAYTDLISQTALQLSETITDFMSFFEPRHEVEKTTIKRILDSTFDIIGKNLENENILVTIQNSVKCYLFINKSSLVQVLLSILGNAKDALIARKVLQATISINVSESKDVIHISIHDNAGGIEESVIKKIGEPYFTTKQELNGTGLGLYVSKTVIEKHFFGTLTWHNEANGACFEISFKN